MLSSKLRNYTDLIKIKNFKDRFDYLKLDNMVGHDTFGFDRYLNQKFYKSTEWKKVRDYVITRDLGCDLGCDDHKILYDKILVHHMNPIRKEDIINSNDILLNPEYLITVSNQTHEALHYSNYDIINNNMVERYENDMCPWKNNL